MCVPRGLLSALVLLAVVALVGATSMMGLHVVGNNIVNGAGQGVVLHGVNHAGTEYMCSQGRGIIEGPTNEEAFWTAILSWNANSIRIPLNSICWLNPPQPVIQAQYGGANYQNAIKGIVDQATSRNMAVILELHWNAPQQGATWPWPPQQRPMPDADHAPAFWTSVANTFKSYSNVIFDLHNEPFPDNNQDTPTAWSCWRDGCWVSQEGYQAVGMTALLAAVRSTGACNVVMMGGVCYANALGSFLQYVPQDAQCGNIAASWHVYDWTVCKDQNCWTNVVGPVAAKYPLIVGEIGEGDCAHDFIDNLMNWLDSIHASYLGWTWNTWNCGGQSNGPSLISAYDGSATNFGWGLKNHLTSVSDSYVMQQVDATATTGGTTDATTTSVEATTTQAITSSTYLTAISTASSSTTALAASHSTSTSATTTATATVNGPTIDSTATTTAADITTTNAATTTASTASDSTTTAASATASEATTNSAEATTSAESSTRVLTATASSTAAADSSTTAATTTATDTTSTTATTLTRTISTVTVDTTTATTAEVTTSRIASLSASLSTTRTTSATTAATTAAVTASMSETTTTRASATTEATTTAFTSTFLAALGGGRTTTTSSLTGLPLASTGPPIGPVTVTGATGDAAATTGDATVTTGSPTDVPTGSSMLIPLSQCPDDPRFTDQLLLGLAAYASDTLGRNVSASSFSATVDCAEKHVMVTYFGSDPQVGPAINRAIADNSLINSPAFEAACSGSCHAALHESGKKGSLPAWAIALIVLGSLLGLVLIGGLIFLAIMAHKRRVSSGGELHAQLIDE